MNENYSVKPSNLSGIGIAGEQQQTELQKFVENYQNQVHDIHNISKRLRDILTKLRGAATLVQKDDIDVPTDNCFLSNTDQTRNKLNEEINIIYNQLDELEHII